MRFLVNALLFAAVVSAQEVAQIGGTVTDASGLVVPGVEVAAIQIDTGAKRTATTGANGIFILPNLALGPYRLEATKTGFRSFVQTGLVLQVGTDPDIPIRLEVGNVSEQVMVESTLSQVETRAVGVGTTVMDSQKILELPLNGRQATDLIPLSGLAITTSPAPPTYAMNTGPSIAVAGSMSWSVQYNLDGTPHIDTYVGTSMPMPFPDALQEFRLSTSSQDASSGGHSGATVDAVTKSGTNKVHGDAFEFFRNGALNGRDFFAKGGDGLKRNQFGGTIGGALIKNRAFFFVGYQGTTVRQNLVNGSAYVPTAAELAGDFSQYISANCPGAQAVATSPAVLSHFTAPFTLSPAANKISSFLPKTNDPCGFVQYGTPVHQNQLQVPARIDYQVSDKNNLFARYIITQINTQVPFDITKNALASGQGGQDHQAQALAIGDTYVISPSMVNSFRIGGTRVGAGNPAAIPFTPKDVGMNYFSYYGNVPILMAGVGFNLNFPSNFVAGDYTLTNFGVNDDVTKVHGSHQFTFGGSFYRTLLNGNNFAWSQGLFVFAGVFGSPMIDFLTGNVVSLHQANPNPNNTTQNQVALYASDTWKATRRLTVSYGVRWTPFLPISFKQNDTFNFSLPNFYSNTRSQVFPDAPPGLLYVGDKGVNGSSGMNRHLSYFSPRLGVSWDPTGSGKTIIRAGAGMSYDFIRMDIHQNTSSVAPYRLTVLQSFSGPGSLSLDNPYANFAGGNPFPYNLDPKHPVFPNLPNQGFLPIDPDLKTPVQYSWNFGVQRQVNSRFFISGTYVGTEIAHLWSNVDLNPAIWLPGKPVISSPSTAAQFGQCAALEANCGGSALSFRRLLKLTNPTAPNVGVYGSLTNLESSSNQSYQGFLLNSRWQASNNVNLGANWTWSHCIGLPATNISNLDAVYPHQAYQNNGPQNRRLDMGDCFGNSLDIRHVVNLMLVAKTPKFASTLTRRLASDWTFSTIFSVRTGAPITPQLNSSVDNALNGLVPAGTNPVPQRPNQVLGNLYATDKGAGSCSPAPCISYLNPAAIATPDLGTYGNMGISTARAPGFWEWDQAVSRQFRAGERARIELRAEGFNLTNSVRFGPPNTTLSGTYGRITSSQSTTGAGTGITGGTGGRIVQFALKLLF